MRRIIFEKGIAILYPIIAWALEVYIPFIFNHLCFVDESPWVLVVLDSGMVWWD